MKYTSLILAIALFSCTANTPKDNTATEDIVVTEEAVPAVTPEPEVITETVYVKDSDVNEDAAVKATFLKMVDAVNNTTAANADVLFGYLDKDYAFKGKDRQENIDRLKKQAEKFETKINNVEIRDIRSSCNLAYVIAAFQKSVIDRTTGDVPVSDLTKVGLFIMHKDTDGKWRLLVQKTDDGFAHWFYMPEAK